MNNKYLFTKIAVVVSLVSSSLVAHAQAPNAGRFVAMAEEAQTSEFEQYLLQNPSRRPYSEWVQLRIQSKADADTFALKIQDQNIDQLAATFDQISDHYKENAISLEQSQYLLDLSSREYYALATKKNESYQRLQCKLEVLQGLGGSTTTCPRQALQTERLKSRFPGLSKIMIETITIDLQNVSDQFVAKNEKYHWTFLSDKFAPVFFFGTYEDIFRQAFDSQPLVTGTCENFQEHFQEIEAAGSSVFFNSNCVKTLYAPPTVETPMWKSKTFWIATGIVLTGALALSLKGKEIRFTGLNMHF